MDLSLNCLLGPNGHMPDFLGSMVNLRYLNLSGIAFTGRVPSQLGNLSKLQYLDLGHFYDSDMYSTDITWLTKLPLLQYLSMNMVELLGIADCPRTLNMLPSLRVIILSECSLHSASQSLPYFNLTKLEKLDLSGNDFGNLFASASRWFWKATSLKYLNLKYNGLYGQLLDALGNMTSLQVLDLSSNNVNKTGNLKNLCGLEILDLSDNNMKGGLTECLTQCKRNKMQELCAGGNNFRGSLPAEIGAFTSLTCLDISYNNLTGSIPTKLGKLRYLTDLDLSHNKITGSIPPEVMRLTSLVSLVLSRNLLNGSIHKEIGSLHNLYYLELSTNNLTGSIPTKLGKLRYLTNLDLSHNKITGPIPPEVMSLTSLVSLVLSSNHFNGSVPTEIGSLPNLTYLYLNNNNFSGVITEEHIAGLKSLKGIDLSSNNLKIVVDSDWLPPFMLDYTQFGSCQMGPLFPAWLRQQFKISELDLSSTDLNDKIPDWFWTTFSQATDLDISNNQISGSLPAHLDAMAIEKLSLSSNQFTGRIPLLPTNMYWLDISNNSFSGTLTSNIGTSNLKRLRMYSNQIVGYIPESICKLKLLSYLDLSNNILEGEIPQCFEVQNIQFLLLGNNSLSGKFPAFLQNSTNLVFLDLAWNKFSGRLPPWVGELGMLRFLLLGHNTFSGKIPVQLTYLRYLQYLDLSGNNFSGAIPWHLSNLTFMTNLQKEFMPLDDGDGIYYINGSEISYKIDGDGYLRGIFSVITKGQQLIYGRTLAYFVSIDLSGNSFTGDIPIDINSLVSLMNLNLSLNQLSGKIPRMIGGMQSLGSLDLSKNKLFGEIPSSLSSLSSLSFLNLSYNNLSGMIPSGRQLDTLNVDNPSLMYIGNSALCGPPLQKNCLGIDTVIHGNLRRSSKQEFELMSFYYGLVLGLVAGHWMVFCAMLFKKTWRIAYFRFVDKLYDRIYVFVAVKWASFARKTTT